jgi:hypothetical protein
MLPKIKIITRFYNEEFLIPFFLRHYAFVDEIHALVSASCDRTVELLRAAPGVTVEEFPAPDGIDDGALTHKLNEILLRPTQADWIFMPDADEFIWPNDNKGVTVPFTKERVGSFLNAVMPDKKALIASMFQVYRHETEKDLDPAIDPVPQRRHGNPDRTGYGAYKKPIVFRANRKVQVTPGQHSLKDKDTRFSMLRFEGAHWAMADLSFCINRCCRDRRDRMSRANLEKGYGTGRWTIQEQEIQNICKSMLRAPKVF